MGTHSLTVPQARAGRINDETLQHLIAAGHALQENIDPTESDLRLLLLTFPQMAEELLQRRKAMDLIQDVTDLENVRFLPCPSGTPRRHG